MARDVLNRASDCSSQVRRFVVVEKPGRKALLKQLVAGAAIDEEVNRVVFSGETSVLTRNTIYRFYDGTCFAVARRDQHPKTAPTDFIGMRILGWLVDEDATPSLSLQWRPGACAVLRRTTESQRDAIALTSPTLSFKRDVPGELFEPPANGRDGSSVRRKAAMGAELPPASELKNEEPALEVFDAAAELAAAEREMAEPVLGADGPDADPDAYENRPTPLLPLPPAPSHAQLASLADLREKLRSQSDTNAEPSAPELPVSRRA
jgi:hypothetical protein